ncbi:MAG: NAD-dependent protein deacylase [Clostridia bacterium]|nr:NAD-dependent protein deacylase [Clostridia bacterium]
MDEAKILELRKIIKSAGKIVFFGGAGVSTASNIPDFRSKDGLYSRENKYGVSPEELLSKRFLFLRPRDFYEFYRENMVFTDYEPNAAHLALARLEAEGRLTLTVTQNIDGLHERAGSRSVVNLHGNASLFYCAFCGEKHSLEYVLKSKGIPRCRICKNMVRPDIVLYGEPLDTEKFKTAAEHIAEADLLIVAGTSLTVYPANLLVHHYEGDLVIINREPTRYDTKARLVIRDPISEVLNAAVD